MIKRNLLQKYTLSKRIANSKKTARFASFATTYISTEGKPTARMGFDLRKRKPEIEERLNNLEEVTGIAEELYLNEGKTERGKKKEKLK